jgi:glyoxylase-like metal-dependent hydrolase (beta-lactamase superfamily II)
MKVKTFALGPLGTNCHVLHGDGRALAVDPGGDPAEVVSFLEGGGFKLEAILNTHFHFDHTAGNAALAKATGAPVYASAEDAWLLDTELGAGGFMGMPRIELFEFEKIEPGEHEFLGLKCRVSATPGHSPGSLSFYFPAVGAAFVGDLVFARSVGRTDFPGGDFDVLKQSVIDHIFDLPDDTVLYTGHGPETTVGDEKLHNPFVGQF